MSKANRLDRRAVVAELLRDRKGAFAVGGLGASTYDIAAAGDHDRNFYLWGGMGGAVMIGLGLALAQPTLPVVVITGDGEMLMGMGSLATVALQQPKNLSIIVLDNEPTARPVARRATPGEPPTLWVLPKPAESEIAARSARWPRLRLLPRLCKMLQRGRGSRARRSTGPIWNACCPAATAPTSSTASAGRSDTVQFKVAFAVQ